MERFFAAVGGSPRLKPRLEALREMRRFGELLGDASAKTEALAKGAASVRAALDDAGSGFRAALRLGRRAGHGRRGGGCAGRTYVSQRLPLRRQRIGGF